MSLWSGVGGLLLSAGWVMELLSVLRAAGGSTVGGFAIFRCLLSRFSFTLSLCLGGVCSIRRLRGTGLSGWGPFLLPALHQGAPPGG
jgi:hypothetical protein